MRLRVAWSRIKRMIRIVTATSLPSMTRRDLLRAEIRAGRRGAITHDPIRVRTGPITLWLSPGSAYRDYVTLYGALVDQHFKLDTPSAAVLDVGAHCGYYAAQAFLHGACAVDSYEPEAANYTMLERAHSSSSARDRWQIQHCAIGAADGEADLFISSESWSHSMP